MPKARGRIVQRHRSIEVSDGQFRRFARRINPRTAAALTVWLQALEAPFDQQGSRVGSFGCVRILGILLDCKEFRLEGHCEIKNREIGVVRNVAAIDSRVLSVVLAPTNFVAW